MKSTIAIVMILLGMAYLIYLDYGCEIGGVMTWGGKVCVTSN